MHKSFDEQYLELVKDILENGYEDSNRTSDKSKKVFGRVLRFDLSKSFPILTIKHTGIKTLTEEMLWIYQKESNIVSDLKDKNINIWNEWELSDGTIGHSYGFQIKKHNQVKKLISELKNNPESSRMIINLWSNEDLDKMSLTPCMFMHVADVNNGKLNWHTTIRSSDVALGLPYNVSQISIMIHMIARSCELEVGELMISITNAHLYEQHYEPIKEIFNRIPYEEPKLLLNSDKKDFYEFVASDVKFDNYQYHPSIKMRVSI